MKGGTIQDKLYLVRLIVEVNGEAALINIDKFKAFDGADHRFSETVLVSAGFETYFHFWIHLFYGSTGVVVEVTGVRSEPFMSRSIRWGCLLSPMLYIPVLEHFIHNLKANLVLHGINISGAITTTRYSAYADDVNGFVKSRTKIYDFQNEISMYEKVTRAKFDVGLRSSPSLHLDRRGCHDIRRLV